MKTMEIVKYAAIAGGVYMVYRYLVQNGMLQDYLGIAYIGSSPALAAVPVPVPGESVATSESTTTYPAGGTPPPAVSAGGDLKAFIASQAAAQQVTGRHHFWEWNYFLPNNVAKPDPFVAGGGRWPLGDSAAVQRDLLSLDEYWAIVGPYMGLGGLGRTVPASSHWGQAASWLN